MKGILQLIGGASIAWFLLGKAATNIANKIVVGFKAIQKANISLFDAKVKLSLVITNNTDVGLALESFVGYLSLGRIRTRVQMLQGVIVPSRKTVVANFSVKVKNGDFLIQLGEQIDSGKRPSVTISGDLTAGIQDKVITIPVNQNIQVL